VDVLRRLLGEIGARAQVVEFAVDIAACDGTTGSNVLELYRAGWRGLAVEGDPERFASLAGTYRPFGGIGLVRLWVTPENVVRLLEAGGVPHDFGVLSLDIDGYDHFVLAALLAAFRPAVICAEINEKIPPPLKFTVRYDPAYRWGEDHFYGQSISKLYELCVAFEYALVELHYNNAFLVPAELGLLDLGPDRAYRDGYLDRADRRSRFPWNEDMEAVHDLDDAGKLAFLEARFARYAGKYELGL
jgi:hypothetical protein